MEIDSTRTRTPYLGTFHNQREAFFVILGAIAVTFGYVAIANWLGTPTSNLEIWSLVFSFACVWLSRTENIYSMATGIVSVAVMGVFLFRVDLVGQAWLQFVYYVPVQIYGWWAWCRGGVNQTELQVSRLNSKDWMKVAIAMLSVWIFFWWLFDTIYENPQFLVWDTSIVSASILAQVLMTRKKVECWYFWTFPVNVSALLLYWRADVPAFSFLYGIFLINAAFGWRQWHHAAKTPL